MKKLTTPEEMDMGKSKLSEALNLFEKELKEKPKGLDRYIVNIKLKLPNYINEEIERRYKNAGWKYVSCKSAYVNKRDSVTTLVLTNYSEALRVEIHKINY